MNHIDLPKEEQEFWYNTKTPMNTQNTQDWNDRDIVICKRTDYENTLDRNEALKSINQELLAACKVALEQLGRISRTDISKPIASIWDENITDTVKTLFNAIEKAESL